MTSQQDSSGVRIPPPLIYLAGLGIGLALEFRWPTTMPSVIVRYAGAGLLITGALLLALVFLAFARSSTSIDYANATSEIITSGPFRFSRNPAYLSMAILSLGMGLQRDSLWMLAMMIPTLAAMHVLVIAKEERYLERKFGDGFLRYKATVRRWL